MAADFRLRRAVVDQLDGNVKGSLYMIGRRTADLKGGVSHGGLFGGKRREEAIQRKPGRADGKVTQPCNVIDLEFDGGAVGIEKPIVDGEGEPVIPGGINVAFVIDFRR